MTSVVQGKRHRKRQAIFDAAARRFAEQGYHGARMQDIADDLDLQKAALYHYFPSKEAILVELIRARVGLALEAVTEVTAADAPTSYKLESAVRAHLRIFHEHANLYTIFHSEKLRTISREAASIVDDLGRQYEKRWAEMLSEGVSQGALRPQIDIPVAVKGVLGMLNTTLTWFEPGKRLTLDHVADRFVDLALAALCVDYGGGPTPSDPRPPH